MKSYPESDRRGALTLSVFSFAWAAAGASALPWALVGWAVIAAAATASVTVARSAGRLPRSGATPPRDAMRRFGLVNLAEILAIVAEVALLVPTGHAPVVPAAVCAVVSVHFIPLARTFRQPLYDSAAVGLGAVAVVGLLLVRWWQTAVLPAVGLGAGSVLLVVAFRLLRAVRSAGTPSAPHRNMAPCNTGGRASCPADAPSRPGS